MSSKRLYLARKITIIVALVLAPLMLSSGDNSASALSGSDFVAGHIIDDAVFTNKNAMSESQIQSWLDYRGSACLRNYVTPEPLGGNKYGSNVRASRAIWKSAQLYDVNPQVILVTLQKEQGLITRGDCPQWRYDWAMGMGCPDNQACMDAFKGFSKQLYQGTRHLRNFYDDSPNWWVPYSVGKHYIQWHPNSGCGGTEVNIHTRGTAALYSYTPYQPNKAALDNLNGTGNSCSSYGNRNFWRDFTNWFGSPTPSRDIVLLRNQDNGAIFVIDKTRNLKFHIATIDAYRAWSFDQLRHANVSPTVLDAYDSGPALRRLAYEHGTGKAYFVDDKKAYHIPNPNMAQVWNLSLSNLPWLPQKVIQYLPSERLAPLVKSPVGPEIYMMDAGTLRHYPSPTVLHAWEISGRAVRISEDHFCTGGTSGGNCTFRWPEGERLGFPKATSPETTKIYFVNNGNKHWLSSGAMNAVYGGGTSTISQPSLNRFFDAPNATPLIRQPYDSRIFLIDNGKYRHIGSPVILDHWKPGNNGRITVVSDNFLKLLVQNSAITSLTATSNNGSYYINQSKHLLEDSLEKPLLAAQNPVPVSAALMQLYPNRDGIETPFVTSPNTPKIFLLNGDGTKHHIGSITDLRLLRDGTGLSIKELPHSLVDNIPEGARVRHAFKSEGVNYLFDNGGYRQITATDWQLSPSFELDALTLGWFNSKDSVGNNFKVSSQHGIVRNGIIYLTSNQKLGELWGVNSSSSVIGSRLISYFSQTTLSPLVRSTNGNNHKIYVYDSQKLYHIPSPAALRTLNEGRFSGNVRLTDAQISALEDTQRATYVLSSISGAMDSGSRRRFADSDTATAWGADTLATYHQTLLELLVQKTNTTNLTRRISSPDTAKHYCIENGTKRWITSPGALSNSSCEGVTLRNVNHNLLRLIPNGPNIY